MNPDVLEAIEKLSMPKTGPVRISAGHLVSLIRYADGLDMSLAMLSVGAHKKGIKRYDALGGAIALAPKGISAAQTAWGATDFYYDDHDETHDARFIVPSNTQARAAMRWLADLQNGQYKDKSFFEQGPRREVYGELTGRELAGFEPVLTADDPLWSEVRFGYLGVAVQPPPHGERGTSVNETKVPSRRIFHMWRMIVPDAFFEQIFAAPQITVLDWTALMSTDQGRQQGKFGTAGLGDNLGLRIIPAK